MSAKTDRSALSQPNFARLRQLMRHERLDAVVVGPGAGFHHLLGLRGNLTERLLCLVVTDDSATILVPRLQAPLYRHLQTETIIWDEHEEPTGLLCNHLRKHDVSSVGVNREFWSGFLIKMQEQAPNISFKTALSLDVARAIKSPREIEALSRASHRIDAVWSQFLKDNPVFTGKTELELRGAIGNLMQNAGFSPIAWIDIGAGENGASSLHHGSEYRLRPGDPVVCDFAGALDGWYADICRVASAGIPEQGYLDAYSVLLEAQEAAFQSIQPGVVASAPDEAARAILAKAGFGDAFTHRVGHGIGLDAHEEPYLVKGSNLKLAVGMVMSVEPGIYLPGRWGMRVEDIVALTTEGPLRLNRAPRAIAIQG
jgi:Xaa-Pro aminopeptidase